MMDSSNFFVYGYEHAKSLTLVPGALEYPGEIESRTVVFMNLPPDLDPCALRTLASGLFGAVAEFQFHQNAAAIRFFDLRHARMMRLCAVRYRTRFLRSAFGAPLPVIDRRKPPNNATLVVFHLPADVGERALWEEFGKFGDIRMIRETPHKAGQRFVEYWDTRSAEAALMAMNGKAWMRRIAIEFSLPGGTRRESPPGVPVVERACRSDPVGCGR
jgi:hypothetical protein